MSNGFMLVDTLAAITICMLFLFPALTLTAQSVSLYRQARHHMEAAAIGRNIMEEMRYHSYLSVPYQQQYDWHGTAYTVTVNIVPVTEQYWRYDITVQGEDGIRHEFHRLERNKTT